MSIRDDLILMVAGATLAIVSTGALVMLLVSLPMSTTEKCLTVAAGVALQVCMYLFSRSADKKCRTMAVVLLLVSVTATAAFMEKAWQSHISQQTLMAKQQQDNSYQVQSLKQSLTILDKKIQIRLDVSERDTSGRFRGRGLEQLDTVAALEQQRDSVLQQLDALYQQKIPTGFSTGSMQALLAGSGRKTRFSVFFLLALLLDLSALLAIKVKQPETTVDSADEADDQQPDTDQPDIKTKEPSSPVDLLRDRILSGEFGIHPSQRKAVAEVTQAFDQLAEMGQIIKNGKRFELVEAANLES